MWVWTGTDWVSKVVSGTIPSIREDMGCAVDLDRKVLVMFGGHHLGNAKGDTWEYWCPTPASFSTFGKGCASTPTPPTISSATTPKLGSQFTLDLKGFLPKPQGGYLILGMSDKKWGIIPLPLSLAFIQAPNCSLFVSLDSSNFFVTDSSGAFSAKFTIPSAPTLIGTTFFGQAWAGDPFANQLGLATTNAFKAVVGW
jgi:hypothetical protein